MVLYQVSKVINMQIFHKVAAFQKFAEKINSATLSLLDMVVQHQSNAQELNEVLCAINSTYRQRHQSGSLT